VSDLVLDQTDPSPVRSFKMSGFQSMQQPVRVTGSNTSGSSQVTTSKASRPGLVTGSKSSGLVHRVNDLWVRSDHQVNTFGSGH